MFKIVLLCKVSAAEDLPPVSGLAETPKDGRQREYYVSLVTNLLIRNVCLCQMTLQIRHSVVFYGYATMFLFTVTFPNFVYGSGSIPKILPFEKGRL